MTKPIVAEEYWMALSDTIKYMYISSPKYFRRCYSSNRKWTRYFTRMLIKIGSDKFGFRAIEKEYWPRVDVSYFDKIGDDWGKWAMEVGIEIENNFHTCTNELRKLMLINCGLKVMITYYQKDRNEIDKLLNDFSKIYKSRKYHTENDNWLLAFFPAYLDRNNAFFAFGFNKDGIRNISDKAILI
jgi:hypothetical protein